MPAKEKVFYQSSDVIVTSTRLCVPTQTFAISSVSSVRCAATRSSAALSVFIFVLGLLFAVTGFVGNSDGNWAIGLILIVAGGWMFCVRKITHHLVLRADSKETRALSNSNQQLIESVILAITEAIEERGKLAEPQAQVRYASAIKEVAI